MVWVGREDSPDVLVWEFCPPELCASNFPSFPPFSRGFCFQHPWEMNMSWSDKMKMTRFALWSPSKPQSPSLIMRQKMSGKFWHTAVYRMPDRFSSKLPRPSKTRKLWKTVTCQVTQTANYDTGSHVTACSRLRHKNKKIWRDFEQYIDIVSSILIHTMC